LDKLLDPRLRLYTKGIQHCRSYWGALVEGPAEYYLAELPPNIYPISFKSQSYGNEKPITYKLSIPWTYILIKKADKTNTVHLFWTPDRVSSLESSVTQALLPDMSPEIIQEARTNEGARNSHFGFVCVGIDLFYTKNPYSIIDYMYNPDQPYDTRHKIKYPNGYSSFNEWEADSEKNSNCWQKW